MSKEVNVTARAPRQTRSRKTTTPEPTPAAAPEASATPALPKPRASRAKATPAPAAPAVVDLRPTDPATLEAEVAIAAYLLWEQGHPGDADAHWYAAEALVRA